MHGDDVNQRGPLHRIGFRFRDHQGVFQNNHVFRMFDDEYLAAGSSASSGSKGRTFNNFRRASAFI